MNKNSQVFHNVGFLLLFSAALIPIAAQGAPPTPAAGVPNAQALNGKGALAQLLTDIKLKQGKQEFDEPVPKECAADLLSVKKTVKGMVAKAFLKEDPSALGAEKFQALVFSEIKDSMGSPGLPTKDENGYDNPAFGSISDLAVQAIPGQPDLWAVQVTMVVGCGSDVSLYLFRKSKEGWKPEINYECTDYDKNGPREDFDFVVSPPDASGGYFVAATYGGPHCQSCWGGMDVVALRQGKDADHPKNIFTGSEFYYRCDFHHLELKPNGFMVDFDARQGLDLGHDDEAKSDAEMGGGIFNRPVVRNYRVEKDKVTLVPPIALYPEDFVDEWLGQPWEFSKNLCLPQNAEKLGKWHQKLGEKDAWSPSILFVQPGKGKEKRWEIGIKTRGKNIPAVLYFEVVRNGDFVLSDIQETRRADCPGQTPAESHAMGEK
jgi:hypothetical protein